MKLKKKELEQSRKKKENKRQERRRVDRGQGREKKEEKFPSYSLIRTNKQIEKRKEREKRLLTQSPPVDPRKEGRRKE